MERKSPTAKPSFWRTPMACQECRKRKIKCDAAAPCKNCQQRNTECTYRDVPRPQRRRRALETEGQRDGPKIARHSVPRGASRVGAPGDEIGNSGNGVFYGSVAATHMASPSCELQLYYGPTSNFSLMQQIYRHLTSGNMSGGPEREEVEEAGPGLDLFSFRRLFFGDMERSQEQAKQMPSGQPCMFLSYSLASSFLERYLTTIYNMAAFRPKDEYRQLLDDLYRSADVSLAESGIMVVLTLAMAIGAATTGRGTWADILFKKAKLDAEPLDEVVNLQTVQIPLLMISLLSDYKLFHPFFQSEKGRPNSSFLHMGTATRKAFAAGLHKGVSIQDHGQRDSHERRTTLWAVYHYETWISFVLGRRNSILKEDITIPPPVDQPFIFSLVQLSWIISDCASQIYGSNHQSVRSLWDDAKKSYSELRSYSRRVFGPTHPEFGVVAKEGEEGFRQAVLTCSYYHTVLLTFRPFLFFRMKWQRERNVAPESKRNTPSSKADVPKWLDEACEYALQAARQIIRFLAEASQSHELIRETQYHVFFLEGACFTLIYDTLRDDSVTSTHLPFLRAAVRCLLSMVPPDDAHGHTRNVINAIHKMFPAVNQGGEPIVPNIQPNKNNADNEAGIRAAAAPYRQGGSFGFDSQSQAVSGSMVENMPTSLPLMDTNNYGPLMSDTGVDSPWNLSNFDPNDVDWDFSFPTMNLESFLSIDPSGTIGTGL